MSNIKHQLIFVLILMGICTSENVLKSETDIDWSRYKKPYSGIMLGISGGTPGILNLNIGYNFGYFDILSSVSLYEPIYLIMALSSDEDEDSTDKEPYDFDPKLFFEIASTFSLYNTGAYEISLGAAGGFMGYDDNEDEIDSFALWYIGPCTRIRYHIFFGEFGLVYGRDFITTKSGKAKTVFPGIDINKSGYFPLIQIGCLVGF